jgi:hypothetical protein
MKKIDVGNGYIVLKDKQVFAVKITTKTVKKNPEVFFVAEYIIQNLKEEIQKYNPNVSIKNFSDPNIKNSVKSIIESLSSFFNKTKL